MVVKESYKFADGRVGTIAKSNLVFGKITEYDEYGNAYKTDKYYDIRKVGTTEEYDVAIDIVEHEYEELTFEEMSAKYKES